ncbi:hypothetical protein ACHAPW_005367 [Verticillium nonalfalfae]
MAESTAPKRWLPFKPTALRQNSNPKPEAKGKVEHGDDNDDDDDDDDDGLSLFKRSKEFFPKVIAAEARRRQRKHAHRDKGKELATPAADARDDSDDPGHGARLSNDSYRHASPSRSRPVKRAIDDSDGDLEDHIETPPSKRSRTSDEYIERKTKTTRSPSYDHPSTPSRHATRSLALRTPKKEGSSPKGQDAVVSLDDSDASDADLYGATPVRDVPGARSSHGAAIVLDDDDDDDPFAEGEQVKASDDGTGSKTDEDKDEEEEEEDEGDDDVEEYIRAARERQKKAEAAQANPTEADQTRITILMTSPIPGTKPVKYLYTLWKPLGKLREVWNSTEGYDVEPPLDDAAVTFITWRGRRLYDSTTLNSLQIRAAENGTLRSPAVRNPHDADGFSDGWTRVHMEMWTEALWDEHKRKEDRRRLRDLGELDDYSDDDDDDGGGVAVGADPEAKETKIKIILKARTGEPVKTTARPASTVAELIEVYRKMRDVPAGTEIQLHFDGEPLDGETNVEDADIEDMDSLEVHLRA